MDDAEKTLCGQDTQTDEVSRFADSYASFSRVVNSLQRRYLELREELTHQNEQLASANARLVELTERNLAATEFLNSILDSVSAGVIAVDRHGCITHFNPAASAVLGIPIIRALRQKYEDVIPAGEPLEATAWHATRTGQVAASVEKQIDLPSGIVRHLSVSTAIVKDSRGRPTGAVEVFQDLTKIQSMEREIARLNTLAALGEMAATVAHQVRNPLSGIIGFASMLEQELDEQDARRKLAAKIIDGVNSLNKTVTTLLEYTRLDELNRTDVDYTEFLKSIVDQFRTEHLESSGANSITLALPSDGDRQVVRVSLDRLLMRQVFFNLFCNAVESGKGRADIEVGCRVLSSQSEKQALSNRVLPAHHETIIETTVADNGPGISPDHLERVFAPFFTTKKDGSGLGLAVAWKIVKAHGGDLQVENRDGGGALFRFLLPARLEDKVRERTE
ncbi:MAG: ATP-binding protein [Candidatus Zixiibacteriota bacterium]